MRKYLLWGAVFFVLLLINILVELILLPYWDLDNTEKNDIYFQAWWIVVGMWFVFGIKIVKTFEKIRTREKVDTSLKTPTP